MLVWMLGVRVHSASRENACRAVLLSTQIGSEGPKTPCVVTVIYLIFKTRFWFGRDHIPLGVSFGYAQGSFF